MRKNLKLLHSNAVGEIVVETWKFYLDGKSENTKRAYETSLRRLLRFLGNEDLNPESATDLLSVTDELAKRYFRFRADDSGILPRYGAGNANVSGSTLERNRAPLKAFYELLQGKRLITSNPFGNHNIKPFRVAKGLNQKRPTEYYSDEEVSLLLEAPSPITHKGIRDRCLFAICFGAGLRRSEVQALRMADVLIGTESCTILLRETKNGEDAIVRVASVFLPYIIPYVLLRRQQNASDYDHFFVHQCHGGPRRLRPINPQVIPDIFRSYTTALGIKYRAPHSARATAITKLLSLGLDYRTVQEFSRHSSVTMVEKYDKRRVADEDSPGLKLTYEKKKI